jgi:hypothetical protein
VEPEETGVTRQSLPRHPDHVTASTDTHATIEKLLLEAVFSVGYVPMLCIEASSTTPREGGLEYLHRSPWSRRKRRKEKPVPGGYNWATLFLGHKNTGIWPSRLGESRI